MFGIISGLFSAGGGLLLVPAYSLIFNSSEKESRATAIFCILPMVIISTAIYGLNMQLNLSLTFKCATGEIIGSVIGSKILDKLKPIYLQILFILFLLYACLKILF